MSSPEYDERIVALESIAGCYRRGIITAGEFVLKLEEELTNYLTNVIDPRDDVELFVAYVANLAEIDTPIVGDRMAGERLIRLANLMFHAPRLSFELEVLLDGLEKQIRAGDPDAIDELEQLCAAGSRTHVDLMLCDKAVEMVLATAARTSCFRALVAAVHPRNERSGQLGAEGRRTVRRLAFDLLAHLAADPAGQPSATEALQELVNLCRHLSCATGAAVRLPIHLLRRDFFHSLSEAKMTTARRSTDPTSCGHGATENSVPSRAPLSALASKRHSTILTTKYR